MANVLSGEDGGCEPPLSAALGLHGLGRGLFATCSHHRLPNAEFSEEPAARQAWPLPQAVVITKYPTDVGEDFSASLLPKEFVGHGPLVIIAARPQQCGHGTTRNLCIAMGSEVTAAGDQGWFIKQPSLFKV